MKNSTKLLMRGMKRMREESHHMGISRTAQKRVYKAMRTNYSKAGVRNYLKAH